MVTANTLRSLACIFRRPTVSHTMTVIANGANKSDDIDDGLHSVIVIMITTIITAMLIFKRKYLDFNERRS